MENKKRALFIDRDGTLIVEPPVDFQVDSLQKLEFIPGVLRNMHFIASTLDFELVMVTNQDGLGTPSFPTSDFLPPHEKMLQTFKGEGVEFDDIIIDRTFENEHKPTRKPGTALLGKYMDGSYDLENSFVIGDRITDIQLAKNLGAKGILLQNADGETRGQVGFAVGNGVEAGHNLQQRGLTHAVRADDADLCAGVHADGDVVEDHLVVDGLAGVMELVDELGHGTSLLVGFDSTLL